MQQLAFKNKVTIKNHLFELEYDLIIEGTRYPRTTQIHGLTPEDALKKWQERRKRTNDYAECEVKGIPSLIR